MHLALSLPPSLSLFLSLSNISRSNKSCKSHFRRIEPHNSELCSGTSCLEKLSFCHINPRKSSSLLKQLKPVYRPECRTLDCKLKFDFKFNCKCSSLRNSDLCIRQKIKEVEKKKFITTLFSYNSNFCMSEFKEKCLQN